MRRCARWYSCPTACSTSSSGERLRIAAHIAAAEWGGAERRSLALLAGLKQRGHDITVYCNTPRLAGHARAAGLTAVIRPLRGDVRLHDALAFARALRARPPDVLIVITFRRLWLAALAARLARVPRVIARVGLASDVARNVKYRFVLRRWIHDVVLNAHAMRDRFEAALPAGARVRISVIPNGVERPVVTRSRAQARRELQLPQDAFVIGTVARLVVQKRVDRLLHALALVPDACAVIAGDGALRPRLEDLANRLGLADRVRFTGHRDDVGNVHATLDAFVVASDQEGMSGAMLEALASGVPVVSTAVTGAAEVLLADPPCGMVVPPDPPALADALARLRDDPSLRARLARAAVQSAAPRYHAARMIAAWEQLLSS